MLSVAAVAEILAYYIPIVDNLLDTLAHTSCVHRRHCYISGGYD